MIVGFCSEKTARGWKFCWDLFELVGQCVFGNHISAYVMAGLYSEKALAIYLFNHFSYLGQNIVHGCVW
jgi:hypothetical protein